MSLGCVFRYFLCGLIQHSIDQAVDCGRQAKDSRYNHVSKTNQQTGMNE